MRPRAKEWLTNGLLVLASIAVTLGALELFLWAHSKFYTPPPAAAVAAPPSLPPLDARDEVAVPQELLERTARRRAVLTMPEEWKKTSVSVPGAYAAYMWHGALHVMNQRAMRWASDFPDKRDGVYRVLVVGDSLTYGSGIAEQDTFTALLNRWMARDYRIEFLNLGLTGGNSTEILKDMRDLVPRLQPDLVIYAMCLNDFLHAAEGQYTYTYAFPLPERVQRFFTDHTRTGVFVAELYDRTLRRFHLRRDFYDDILSDFRGHQERFRREVAEMNSLVRSAGLPPMIAMVVDQYPSFTGQGYKIAQAAEGAFKLAGIDAIPTENYYRRYHGQGLYVTKWEGHPDEVANFIWATTFMRKLQARPDIQALKKSP